MMLFLLAIRHSYCCFLRLFSGRIHCQNPGNPALKRAPHGTYTGRISFLCVRKPSYPVGFCCKDGQEEKFWSLKNGSVLILSFFKSSNLAGRADHLDGMILESNFHYRVISWLPEAGTAYAHLRKTISFVLRHPHDQKVISRKSRTSYFLSFFISTVTEGWW